MYLGCWSNGGGDPTLTTLEGTGNPHLGESYTTREDKARKCARAADFVAALYFALFDGGQCYTSSEPTLPNSDDCVEGFGTTNAVDVYSVSGFSCSSSSPQIDTDGVTVYCQLPVDVPPFPVVVTCDDDYDCEAVGSIADTDVSICCKKWGSWTSWSSCSVTCGVGSQTRTRPCLMEPCDVDSTTESRDCMTIECPLVVEWGSWTSWSSCSVTCGVGSQTRTRPCLMEPCDVDSTTESRDCMTIECPLVVDYMYLGCWSNGGGDPTLTTLEGTGNPHLGESYTTREDKARKCARAADFVAALFFALFDGGQCYTSSEPTLSNSDDCFEGFGTTNAVDVYSVSGFSCSSSSPQIDTDGVTVYCQLPVDVPPFPVVVTCDDDYDCEAVGSIADTDVSICCKKWGPWTTWSSCTATCGGGSQTRTRQCLNEPCGDTVEEVRDCMTIECPLIFDYVYLGCWSDDSTDPQLITLEDTGNPHLQENFISREEKARKCARAADHVEASYFALLDGGQCFASSEPTTTSLSNECVDGFGTNIGADVYSVSGFACSSSSAQTNGEGLTVYCYLPIDVPTFPFPLESCEADYACEIVGAITEEWDIWTEWSECLVTCGGSTQTRTRSCMLDSCDGPSEDTRDCMTIECPQFVEYFYVGCWSSVDILFSLEGTSPHLDGAFGIRTDRGRKCARAASDAHKAYFALKDGGECYAFSDLPGSSDSAECVQGFGTNNAIDVYSVTELLCSTGIPNRDTEGNNIYCEQPDGVMFTVVDSCVDGYACEHVGKEAGVSMCCLVDIECPPNQVYNSCGSACPPTCDIPFPVGECTEQCIEGCFCEDGLILDIGNVCIPQSECGCYVMNTLYRFNEILPNGETCSCEFTNTVCSGCHFYELNTTPETWYNAKNICEDKGGRLAVLNEASVFNLVRQFIFNNGYDDDVKHGFWFGLNDLVNESEFVWSDNTTLLDGDYTMWARKQPSGGIRPLGDQDCVQMWKKRAFRWDDTNCAARKGYICEYTDGCF
uniref:SCO-spondin-like n=1 Tax=Saccoglossus kowalevskii TaxID=10224 RepID=A0ABM0GWD8_SACKO|nr:PREDICTED: SCO-spondin-like [Saccoglossus kowalevskii]